MSPFAFEGFVFIKRVKGLLCNGVRKEKEGNVKEGREVDKIEKKDKRVKVVNRAKKRESNSKEN